QGRPSGIAAGAGSVTSVHGQPVLPGGGAGSSSRSGDFNGPSIRSEPAGRSKGEGTSLPDGPAATTVFVAGRSIHSHFAAQQLSLRSPQDRSSVSASNRSGT